MTPTTASTGGVLLCFEDEQAIAQAAATAAGLTLAVIERHRFPDGELRLRLPEALSPRVAIWRSLHQPNEKIVELLLAAPTSRLLGAQHLTLRVEQASLKSDAARDKLQVAFAALGRSEVLTIEQGPVTDSWAKRNQAKLAARQQAAEALILNDPMVQDLQAHWGAKIVPGSIKAL